MAQIQIYDATELDKQQLSHWLEHTDHNWNYVQDKISMHNLDESAEVISVFVTSAVSAEMIAAMPRLKLIACRSTGYSNIDMLAAEAAGISVVNVPTYGESTVAEYAFTLLLGLIRKLPLALTQTSHLDQAEIMGSDLYGKTFGVIGTGHIGQKSISIAKGFGMKVVAYDPFPNEEAAIKLQYSYQSLDEVLAISDVISLHAPLTPQTKHIINTDALSKMKQDAIIVNTARGELIDSKALIIALGEDKIGGAALDVVEGEEMVGKNEEIALLRSEKISSDTLLHSVEIATLSRMPNVIVTPHNAFNTTEAVGRINSTTAQNMITFWYGESPNIVHPGKVTTGKLLLVRHTESEWNATGQWTGTRDKHLSERGFREAALLGYAVKAMDVDLDIAFCSQQIRTLETLEAIVNATAQIRVPLRRSADINERDYGEYTGLNKYEVKETVGEEQWNAIRRGWDVAIPDGESLKMVYERVIPFYKKEILPLLLAGKNVLVVAHGNSLRALMKYIEQIPDEQVAELEMLFGHIVDYEVDEEGLVISKEVTTTDFRPIDHMTT